MKTNLEPFQPIEIAPQAVIASYADHFHPTGKKDARAIRKDSIARISNFDALAAIHLANTRCAQAQSGRAAAENAASKAEVSNKTKSDFLADMSHEIRTPLGAIVGLARHLMTTQLDSQQKDCLAMLQGCADDLMAMLNNSLDIDKIESGTVQLDHVSFSMHALLSNIVGIMSVKAQEKNIGLTLHHATGNYETFVGDSGRIRQILINLIGNAIKFTKIGNVDVSLFLGAKDNGKQTMSIAVADTGIGITADKMETVFQRFAQADASILREFGGTGLGLSIAKAMAESLGGALGVTSVVGKGSVFTFTVALTVEAAKTNKSINHVSFDECQMSAT